MAESDKGFFMAASIIDLKDPTDVGGF